MPDSRACALGVRAFIFDLDGTVLDTLDDLVALTNAVLAERGWPVHSREAVQGFVGNGAHALMVQAVPAGIDEAGVAAALARWKELYGVYGHKLTRPFPGMSGTLARLKAEGACLGVLSNKFDAAARAVIAEHFPDTFDIVHGECADYPRKPDPTGLRRMIGALGVEPGETAYIGDSVGDMDTAAAAGAIAIGVAWGYQPASALYAHGARMVIGAPGELTELL